MWKRAAPRLRLLEAQRRSSDMIWGMCPKERFAGADTVRIAAGLAVCIFNSGAKALLPILQSAGCSVGRYTEIAVNLEDATRVSSSSRRVSAVEKEKRKKRRRRRRGWEEVVEQEGVTNGAGAF